MITKTCSKCSLTKDSSEFAHNSSSKDGLQAYCKKCQINYSKDRHKKIKARLKYLTKKAAGPVLSSPKLSGGNKRSELDIAKIRTPLSLFVDIAADVVEIKTRELRKQVKYTRLAVIFLFISTVLLWLMK